MSDAENAPPPSHQDIAVAVAKVQTTLEFVAGRQQEHIRESQEARAKFQTELALLTTRTAVLESHESPLIHHAGLAAAPPPPPHWTIMAAAGVAIVGGLASTIHVIELVAIAIWQALKSSAA